MQSSKTPKPKYSVYLIILRQLEPMQSIRQINQWNVVYQTGWWEPMQSFKRQNQQQYLIHWYQRHDRSLCNPSTVINNINGKLGRLEPMQSIKFKLRTRNILKWYTRLVGTYAIHRMRKMINKMSIIIQGRLEPMQSIKAKPRTVCLRRLGPMQSNENKYRSLGCWSQCNSMN